MPENAERVNMEKDPGLQRVPPHSLEAEESILSALLIDSNALYEVLDVLSSEDFYRSAHQKIFACISELFSRNEPVDLVTVTNLLRDKQQLDEIGGATFLNRLLDEVPRSVNPEHHAQIVRDKSSLRRLISQAHAIEKRCFMDQGNVQDVVDFAESVVFEIAARKSTQAFYPLSKIIEGNIDALEERQGNRTLITGVPTGFRKLDELTSGFQNSDLIILAARPSMGKTALALNIARNAAVESGIPVAVFSIEMSKEQLSLRMLCSEARVDSARLRSGFFSREDWIKLTNAADLLSEAPIYIDDSPDISAMSIRTKSRRLKLDKDIGLVIVDYLQLMKSQSSAERRDLEISEISRSLKALAKELSLPVLALSQLNRKLEERHDKRPQLADLRESGALEQDADVVAFIYRDDVYNRDPDNPKKNTAEVLLRKQRNGPTGEVHMAFLGAYTRFEDMADDSYVKA